MDNMEIIIFVVLLGILGLFLGSFAGASVWRLRAKQLKEDADAGEKVTAHDKQELGKLTPKSILKDRSICLHCGHRLKWYDLIPLVSWVGLKGKCRYCHKKIGYLEPLVEFGVAAFFVVSLLFWPVELTGPVEIFKFVLWLIGGVGLAILVVYDKKWFLLPNRVIFPLIGAGALYSLAVLVDYQFEPSVAINIVSACLILSGIYYAIYFLSRGQWVGFGDVKLGLALALFLADWKLAILALFLANAIGTIVILPLMLAKRIKRQAQIPFGPLLISGWLIAGLFGGAIIDWYLGLTLVG